MEFENSDASIRFRNLVACFVALSAARQGVARSVPGAAGPAGAVRGGGPFGARRAPLRQPATHHAGHASTAHGTFCPGPPRAASLQCHISLADGVRVAEKQLQRVPSRVDG
jgi:hypothetical protein